jgi:hypothetical protein
MRDRVPPLLGRRPGREALEQSPEGSGGEPLGLQQRNEETQGKQHPRGDDAPCERVERLLVQIEDPGGEVVDEVGRQEEQRGHGHRHERPALRLGCRAQPIQVDEEHAERDRQGGVRLGLARHLHQGRGGTDLKHVLRAARRRAAGQRPAAGDHGREQRPRNEEGGDAEHQGVDEPARRGGLQAAHRERQEQVEGEDEGRRLRQDSQIERQR